MKLLVMIEAEVSSTIADTIRRNGLKLVRDGSSMRLSIENTPPIPSRKVRVEILDNGSLDSENNIDRILEVLDKKQSK